MSAGIPTVTICYHWKYRYLSTPISYANLTSLLFICLLYFKFSFRHKTGILLLYAQYTDALNL